MKRTEKRWCIIGKFGGAYNLYVGQTLTRSAAIKEHLDALGYSDWKQCRRKGDRAVRVTIEFEVPDA